MWHGASLTQQRCDVYMCVYSCSDSIELAVNQLLFVLCLLQWNQGPGQWELVSGQHFLLGVALPVSFTAGLGAADWVCLWQGP